MAISIFPIQKDTNLPALIGDVNSVILNLNQVIANLEAGIIPVTQIELGDGTATTPSLTYSAETNTGFYRKGSHNIGLTLNGTESVDFSVNLMTITGIGTASTSFKAPLFDALAAGALNIGTTVATSINLKQPTVLSSTLTGGSTSDITINTNKFTVAASTGNTVIAGTLNTGATTFTAAALLDGGTGKTIQYTNSVAAPSIAAGGTLTNHYGGDTNFLGDPTIWAIFKIGATEYKLPLY